MSAELTGRLLEVMEGDILPLTRAGTEAGNKVFGAAILRKSDLSLVLAATNQETQNPLFHGEISCLNQFWGLPADSRPDPKDCLFLSTHEPCSLCLSAITWSGFDNFYYVFSYFDSRDSFNIPHDLKILEEVFACKDGHYCRENQYWTAHYLLDMVDQGTVEQQSEWRERLEKLKSHYGVMSDNYQKHKDAQDIPLN
ncbi:nucleoside deaminase [Hahella ganghwensis]|uniref:nucleoside deaminase n=1 Tax=Hahella ganghwensis TaxID=286420 RepID=UPI000377F2BD|nr:nucleoside deaminase [Hahella ganghwensis]